MTIISLISLSLGLINFIIFSLVSFLFFEVVASLFPYRTFKDSDKDSDDSHSKDSVERGMIVLVPAHNEETVIRGTLDAIRNQLRSIDRIFVVADNCSDSTADIARSADATVLERYDDSQRGKGYALDFGLKAMAQEPPDVVIVVDADCIVQPGALTALREQALSSGQPAQAVYLMEQPQVAGPKDQISAFAFKVKNLVRPRGLTRFRLPCPLTGTGMAFPWNVIADANLASGNIVEDMKLGVDLAIAGYPTLLCSEALVLGQLPSNDSASTGQRTRWEHGHLQTLLTSVPQLLLTALKKKRLDLVCMAIDLAIPPLALFVLVWLVCLALSLIASFISTVWAPTAVLAIAGVLLTLAILLAWVRFGRDILTIRQLLSVPLYILWKIPLYFKFIIRPQSQWVRTERVPSSDSLKN